MSPVSSCAAARSHQSDGLTRSGSQVDSAEHRRAGLVAEADIAELHFTLEQFHCGRAGCIAHEVIGVEDSVDCVQRDADSSEGLVGIGEALDWPEQPADVSEKGHQGP